MFKPQTFRFKNTIHWPGVGPASEIHAENISKVDAEGDEYTFVHASGHAVKVPKAQVTAYGVYDADDVPNLPKEKDYKDDVTKIAEPDPTSRVGGHTTPLPTEPTEPLKADKKNKKEDKKDKDEKKKKDKEDKKDKDKPSTDSNFSFFGGKK